MIPWEVMSGTSGDGVDASIIETNGIDQYHLIKDKYYGYSDIYKDSHKLKDKIHKSEHLIYKNEINNLERKYQYFTQKYYET